MEPIYIVGGIAVVVGVIYAGICFAVITSVAQFSRRDLKFRRIDPTSDAKISAALDSHLEWADGQGFDFVGLYHLNAAQSIFIAAWSHAAQASYFCVYFTPVGEIRDCVTLFEGDHALTTGNAKDTQMLPLPAGCFAQSFSDLTRTAQWEHHLAAEGYLMRHARLQPAADVEFIDALVHALRSQMEHVKSIPFWYLRGPWWYFVTRNVRHGVPIEEQVDRGWVDLNGHNAAPR